MTYYHRQLGLRYPPSHVAASEAMQTAIDGCYVPADSANPDSAPVERAKLQVATACVAALHEHFPPTGTPAPHVAWDADLPARGPAVEPGQLHPALDQQLTETLSSKDKILECFPLLRGPYSSKVPIEIYLGRVWASVKHAFPINWDGAQLTAGSHYFLRALFPPSVLWQPSERHNWSLLCRQIITHMHPNELEPSADFEITQFFCSWFASPARTFGEAIRALRSDIDFSPVPVPGFALVKAAQTLATDYELKTWFVDVLWPAATVLYADGYASLETNVEFGKLLGQSLASVPPHVISELRPSKLRDRGGKSLSKNSNQGRKSQTQRNGQPGRNQSFRDRNNQSSRAEQSSRDRNNQSSRDRNTHSRPKKQAQDSRDLSNELDKSDFKDFKEADFKEADPVNHSPPLQSNPVHTAPDEQPEPASVAPVKPELDYQSEPVPALSQPESTSQPVSQPPSAPQPPSQPPKKKIKLEEDL